jgi:hypothetical protein
MISTVNIDPRALALAQLMREKYGLQPSSSYRGVQKNADVGGAQGSQHLHGRALDYSLKGLDDARRAQILEEAYKQGARGVGIYGATGDTLHLDFRDGPPVIWGNGARGSYRGMDTSEAAAWAQPVLANYYKPGDGTTPNTQMAGMQTPTGGLLAGLGGTGTGLDADLLKGLLGGSKTQDPNALLLQQLMQPRQQPQEHRPQPGELWSHWGQMPVQFDPNAIPLLKSFGA